MGRSASLVVTVGILFGAFAMTDTAVAADDHEIVIEDEEMTGNDDLPSIDEELVIEDEAMPGDGDSTEVKDDLVIEDDVGTTVEDELVIEDGESPVVEDAGDLIDESEDAEHSEGGIVVDGEEAHSDSTFASVAPKSDPAKPTFGIDDAWAEGAYLTDSSSPANWLGYGKLAASVNWQPDPLWEFQLAGRLDIYDQGGSRSDTKIVGDYSDSFLRYRGENLSLTAGSQTLIWGRIDELPPSDRVSTVDLRRFILDDLPDRRVSTPMLRAEAFFGASKLDLVWLYAFREAELPDQKSIWYPIKKDTGHLFGLAPSAGVAALFAAGASIDEDAPSGDGGFAARYTRTQSNVDFGAMLGKTRQSIPYFRLDGADFEAVNPRSWIYGLDAAFEGAGGTWRLEALYASDTPVTRTDLSYTTTPSLSWGGAVEFHPGDGDTRVNLQLTGINLIDEPKILDRDDIYSFNGAIEAPFAHNRWRANIRFFIGLDEDDIYINPKLSFVGWEPHELYLSVHYFDGDDKTVGGFYKDNSVVNVGWRASF